MHEYFESYSCPEFNPYWVPQNLSHRPLNYSCMPPLTLSSRLLHWSIKTYVDTCAQKGMDLHSWNWVSLKLCTCVYRVIMLAEVFLFDLWIGFTCKKFWYSGKDSHMRKKMPSQGIMSEEGQKSFSLMFTLYKALEWLNVQGNWRSLLCEWKRVQGKRWRKTCGKGNS